MSRPTGRVDWLQLLSADGLDEYRAAADHHHRSGLPGRSISLLSMLVVGFVAAAGALGIAASEPAAKAERAQLQSRVIAARAAASAAEVAYVSARKALTAAEADAERGLDDALVEQLRIDAALSGYARVDGPGVQLTLNDAITPRMHNAVDLGLVIDRDVQHAVNALWQAGAEAISINDRRITATSPISNAGDAILVDRTPIKPPYIIRAVGDAKALTRRFGATAEWDELQALRDRYGVRWNLESAERLQLPPATSAFPRVARIGATG